MYTSLFTRRFAVSAKTAVATCTPLGAANTLATRCAVQSRQSTTRTFSGIASRPLVKRSTPLGLITSTAARIGRRGCILSRVSSIRTMATKVDKSNVDKARLVSRNAMVIGGVIVVGGSISYIVWKTSKFMSNLTFTNVTMFGAFIGGIVTAAGGAAIMIFGRRFFSVHPETFFNTAYKTVAASPIVQKSLGPAIKPSNFRAYSHVPTGGLASYFKPHGVQLIFQVNGANSSGIVSCEAQPRGLQHSHSAITSLAVDFSDGSRVVLAGDPDKVIYQGIIQLR